MTTPLPEVAATIATKFCTGCKQQKSTGEFGPSRQHKDGLNPHCRPCSNQYQRRAYHKRMARRCGLAHVPPELFPPASPGETITCLQCRHCELTDETDFTRSQPVIHCNKQDRACAICLEGCPLADPRPAQPKHLHRYWIKYGPLGDKATHATPVLLAYLKARWSTMQAADLERETGRTLFKLAQIVRYHKIGGVLTSNNRLSFMDPRHPGKQYFTPEQTTWIMSEYRSQRWPRPLVYCLPPDEYGRREAQQQTIVEHVATLGPRWSWEQIRRHVEKRMRKQADGARRARRGIGRCVNQHVTLTPGQLQQALSGEPHERPASPSHRNRQPLDDSFVQRLRELPPPAFRTIEQSRQYSYWIQGQECPPLDKVWRGR